MRAFLLVVAVTASGVAPTARAENRPAAREAYKDGMRHYDLGQFHEALENFMRAYWNFEDPAFLFNIGQCHRQLGDKAQALQFYRTYLRKVPDAPNAEEVRRLAATMKAALDEEGRANAQPPQGAMESHVPPPPPHEAKPASSSAAPAAVSAPVTTAPVLTVVASPVSPAGHPLWRRWWLWTAVGVGVAAAVGVGLGVGLGHGASSERTFTPVTIQ